MAAMWSPTILPNHRHSWLRGFNVVAWLSAGSGSDVPCIEMDANADSRYVRQRRDWNKNARRTMVSPRGCLSSNKTLMSQVSATLKIELVVLRRCRPKLNPGVRPLWYKRSTAIIRPALNHHAMPRRLAQSIRTTSRGCLPNLMGGTMCIQRWPLAMFSIVIQRSRPLTLRRPLMYQYRCVWGCKLGPTAADEMVSCKAPQWLLTLEPCRSGHAAFQTNLG
ncbi:hypothetical protein X797_009173 [Metarhizium robertsii]|uniref:Uncharacterized protein n=1 Tax=Metarhizium robertsii TaxID=568076 RepID=A0A0A1UQ77_9HYPO|nr:hypothetical protein X797_009173 [Metarhizium robertsii]